METENRPNIQISSSFLEEKLHSLEELLKQKGISHVKNRNGEKQELHLDRIQERIQRLAFGLDRNFINIDLIIQKVIQGMYDGVCTTVLDNLSAETAAYMNIIHPHYSILAARIAVSNLHKETKESFSETISDLYTYIDEKTKQNASLIAQDVYEIVMANAEKIQKIINFERDYTFDFFGFKTLERSYLLKINGKIAERPQHMLMRVSIGIHKEDLESAFETYNLMSEKWFTHATPTLFNSGTPKPQMSSCFLLDMKDDSIEGIYDTLQQCAQISKSAGGIGLSTHKVRAKNSYIKGTNGNSNGLIPMLQVFNETARYVDQGGGKRKGSFAIYLEPWHADIVDFLQLRKNTGKEENRARDLFFALWTPDLFMKRVTEDQKWTLMCPNECPGLHEVWGEEFEKLYESYQNAGKGRAVINARELWTEIINSQIETGTPYMLYKDSCNRKSNQQNLGTIKSSNLCTEIIQYTSDKEVAVCNLASISLPRFVKEDGLSFDFDRLREISMIITQNLNRVIDENFYPVPEARYSNFQNRPIGIGVQGLADAFILMRIPFESSQALQINKKIFQTIYYGACKASMQIAKSKGPYESFKGSPASKGILQFDMWNVEPSSDFDWNGLQEDIVKYGMRNSLLIAPMPTASTSQILGNCESFEPYTANLFTRRVLAGEFVCINQHLVKDLIKAKLWTPNIKNKLIHYDGSVQHIEEIPSDLKALYKTIWEISQKSLIDLAIGRAPFIDQSQSLNIYMADPNYSKMCSMHFYAWEKGLKTGMYYLRSRPAADPIQFTVDIQDLLQNAGNILVDKKKKNKQNFLETEPTSDQQNLFELPKKQIKGNNQNMIEGDKENLNSTNLLSLIKTEDKNQKIQEDDDDEPICMSCGS